ncbi:MAG: hypothetical protein AB1467_00455 [Candidatus Diapherotrites archaeon]
MKGQLISLDFLLSLILVVFSIGIVLQIMELTTYTAKEDKLQREVQYAGERAAFLLATNPNITCDLADVRDFNIVLGSLRNCLTKVVQKKILEGYTIFPPYNYNELRELKLAKPVRKSDLGLPDYFDCKISVTGGLDLSQTNPDLFLTECKDASGAIPSTATNVYSADFNVVFHGSSVNDALYPARKAMTSFVRKDEYYACQDRNFSVCDMNVALIKLWVWKK